MTSQDVLAKLRENENFLRARGVLHAALFGSLARGENRPDSDIDILIEIEPGVVQDIYSYVGLKNDVASLFEGRVDVVNREALKSQIRSGAATDALYAF